MNQTAEKVLSQLLNQFEAKHKRRPARIVVTPLAALALAVKRSLRPIWQDIPVECREIDETEATNVDAEVRSLAVFVLPEDRTARLVACDLKT